MKHNGKTYKAVKMKSCKKCAFIKDYTFTCFCPEGKMWRETFVSRIKSAIENLMRYDTEDKIE